MSGSFEDLAADFLCELENLNVLQHIVYLGYSTHVFPLLFSFQGSVLVPFHLSQMIYAYFIPLLFHLLVLFWFPSGFCPVGSCSFLFNQLFLSPWLCPSASYLVSSAPIFHGCVNERLADRTPSPTFSTADSDITELADEQQDEMEDFDDEAFVDDTGSDAGTEEGSDLFSDGHDPFYDRSPWFILVGRLVRLK